MCYSKQWNNWQRSAEYSHKPEKCTMWCSKRGLQKEIVQSQQQETHLYCWKYHILTLSIFWNSSRSAVVSLLQSCDCMLCICLIQEMVHIRQQLDQAKCVLYWEVLIGHSFKRGAWGAETILQKLLNLYEKLEVPSLAPTQECFTLLIEAWLNSREPGTLEKTENTLQLIQDLARQYENKDL